VKRTQTTSAVEHVLADRVVDHEDVDVDGRITEDAGGGLALYITQCRSRRLTCLCSTPCRIIRPHVITVINACPDELAVNLVNCSSLFILYKNELNAQYQYQ